MSETTVDRRHFRGELLTKAPEGLFRREHDIYGYATVEVQDRDGDVIKVDGIRMEHFKRAGSLPLIGAAHRYSATASGDYPTVGKVVELVRTTKRVGRREVPALAFAADMEKGDDGQVTEYAKKIKSKYDQRILSSFSIGADVYKASPREGGRYNVEDSDIYEVSCCLVPSNFEATILRSLKAEFGEDFSEAEVLVEMIHRAFERQAECFDGLAKEVNRRIDDVESAVVAASEGRRGRPATDNPRPLDTKPILDAIERLQHQLRQ